MHAQLSWLIPVLGGFYLFAVYLVLLIWQNNNFHPTISTLWEIITKLQR